MKAGKKIWDQLTAIGAIIVALVLLPIPGVDLADIPLLVLATYLFTRKGGKRGVE